MLDLKKAIPSSGFKRLEEGLILSDGLKTSQAAEAQYRKENTVNPFALI